MLAVPQRYGIWDRRVPALAKIASSWFWTATPRLDYGSLRLPPFEMRDVVIPKALQQRPAAGSVI